MPKHFDTLIQKLSSIPPNSGCWVGFDLDGTLAHYDHWRGMDHIGAPIPAMCQIVNYLHSRRVKCKIMTARACSGQSEEDLKAFRTAMDAWCLKYLGFTLEVTAEKDWHMLYLFDDRAFAVKPNEGTVAGLD